MWTLSFPLSELVIRASAIYLIVFILLRIIGKKQIGEMSPFDFILLLIISEAVSNGLQGDEKSITGAGILALVLVSINAVIDRLSFRYPKVEKLIEGQMQILVQEGRILDSVRKKEKITMSELESSLREHGLREWKEVYLGVIETNGMISMVPYNQAKATSDTSRNSPSH